MSNIIKYPGGKKWLGIRSERLVRELDPNYVAEPCAGGLSFSLHNRFDKVLANDLITPLINLYQQAQNGFIPNRDAWVLDKEFYLNARAELNNLVDTGCVNSKEAAELFWGLSMHGFNGLCRFNLKGHWNVPFGQYDKVSSVSAFNEFRHITKNWQFTNNSYENLNLRGVQLILADPPYAGTFANYSGKGFTFTDQIKYANWLADHDVPIIACNSANRELAKIYKARGFSVYQTDVARSISCKKDGRKSVKEMIAFRGFGLKRKFTALVDNVERWRV